MDRLKVLQGDPNISNTSQGGYETADDDYSFYYSLTENSLTEDDADITTIARDKTISDGDTPLQCTGNNPNMIDAAGQLQTIPDIFVSSPTDKQVIEQFCEINAKCAISNEEHAEVAHSEMVDGIEELNITPVPQATTQTSNKFNNNFSSTINLDVCTKMSDEPTEFVDDVLQIGNEPMSPTDDIGHLSTIEEIDEICDLQPITYSKPLNDMTNTINSTVGVETKSQIDPDLLLHLDTCKKENTATGTKGIVKRSTRISLSSQHRLGTIKKPAGLHSSVEEAVPDKCPNNIINVLAQKNTSVKTRQSLASKTRSPNKRNGIRHSMNNKTEFSQAAGASKMLLRRSTRLSVAHGKIQHKTNAKSPSKIITVALPSRPIVKSPLNPNAVAAEARAVAATCIPKPSFICGVCTNKFMSMKNLKTHKKSHESSNMCQYCNKSFKIRSALETHLRENCTKIPSDIQKKLSIIVPQRPAVIVRDNLVSSSSLGTPKSASSRKKAHSGLTRTPSKLRCHACGKQFKDMSSFLDHSDTHVEEETN